MVEEAEIRLAHDHVVPIAGSDDQIIPNRSCRLSDVLNARPVGPFNIVIKGEEGVRS